jgi:thiol-disulfide isomerase/thioredoxin
MYIKLSGTTDVRTVAQIYASQPKIRELTDANFWNIFYDSNKVLVVSFWANSCATCNDVAETLIKVAERCYKGPYGQVKFYHIQWDKTVNPKIYEQFGFKSIPVVFFYYTTTGRPPTRECPLLEGALPDKSQETRRRIFDLEPFLSTIRNILRRHQNNVGQSGLFQEINFYDRVSFRLAYLGKLRIPWCRNSSQIRLIERAEWTKIYDESRKPRYDTILLTQQIHQSGLILQVASIEDQRKQLENLFKDAKKSEKEQGIYIVVEVKNQKARLYFERAKPVTSSRDEFEFEYGRHKFESPKGIRFVPNDPNKQVIGTLHTHYIQGNPSVNQTTHTGTTWSSQKQSVERIVHAVSEKDILAAKIDQIVVYAMEADQIHKALPNGSVINGIKKPFNVLIDALESFAGKTR